jgi:hypothetical protein
MRLGWISRTNFSRLRERLVQTDIACNFLDQVLRLAKAHRLLSAEHFTVDSTLIESWASLKSLKKDGKDPKDGGDGTGMVDFKGERRTNQTHQSSTDPDAKLMRRGNGQPAKLCFGGHALMENRSGLCADLKISDSRMSEPKVAQQLLARLRRKRIPARTLGADKGYHSKAFVEHLRASHPATHRTHRRTDYPGLGCAHHATPELSNQSTHQKAYRGDLWLAQDGRRHEKEPRDRYRPHPDAGLPCGQCLQSAQNGAPGADQHVAART